MATCYKVYTDHTGEMRLWATVAYLAMAEAILARVRQSDSVDGMVMEVIE